MDDFKDVLDSIFLGILIALFIIMFVECAYAADRVNTRLLQPNIAPELIIRPVDQANISTRLEYENTIRQIESRQESIIRMINFPEIILVD